MKKNLILICLSGLCLISLFACGLSFYRLGSIPYGFHVDEYTGSVNIGCLATEGVDAHDVRYPLFAITGYGTPKPPTYIYPGIFWAHFFGYSVASLRAFSVTVHIIGIIGLFFLARLFLGWRYAVLTVTVASLSPWVWGLSRVAFESLFAATFLIWGLFFFFKSPKIICTVLAGLFFAAAMYSYPPFRVQTPLMLLTLGVYTYQKKTRTLQSWMIFALTVIVPLIPLIQKTLSGEIQKRFDSISIFSKEYLASIHSSGSLIDVFKIFINNFLMHFSGDFLFFKGDPSYVHSTGHFGILGWLDILALLFGVMWLLMLLNKKDRSLNPLVLQKSFLVFLVINILWGFLPSGLTNSELPNSLRITGAWPFESLLSGYLLWQSCERWWGMWIVVCLVSILFAVAYFNTYFKVFPQEGRWMFAYWTLEEAGQVKTEEDWFKFVTLYREKDYTARYYLMQYKGLSCSQSDAMWHGVKSVLMSHGIY